MLRPLLRFNRPGTGLVAGAGFENSWFASEPLIFQDNLAFWVHGVQFRVGDCARLNDSTVVRIQRLFYAKPAAEAKGDDVIPPLRLVCTRFVKRRALDRDSASLLPRSVQRDQLVHVQYEEHEFGPDDIDCRVFVGPAADVANLDVLMADDADRLPNPRAHPQPTTALVCNFELAREPPLSATTARPYSTACPLFTLVGQRDGRNFVWFEVGIDAFSHRKSRPASITAVYSGYTQMLRAHRSRDENIELHMLFPKGVSLYEVRFA